LAFTASKVVPAWAGSEPHATTMQAAAIVLSNDIDVSPTTVASTEGMPVPFPGKAVENRHKEYVRLVETPFHPPR
jgi:hypothetical protein